RALAGAQGTRGRRRGAALRRRPGAADQGRRRGRSRERGHRRGRRRRRCHGGRTMSPLLAKLPPVWREAVEELWRRRLRTLLTLLGLIFGVGAIVAMQAVGEGSRREALKLVESLGLRNLIAEAKPQDDATLRENRARSLGLTVSDAQAALAVVPGAE